MSLFSLGGTAGYSDTTLNTTGQSNQNETQQSTNTASNTSTSTNTATQAGTQQATQDPYTTAARQGLYNMYNQQINQASGPVYGTGFQAGFAGGLDQQAQASTDALKQTLAGSGQLDSGALATGASSIQNNKINQGAQMAANLPAMEAAAQTARINPLLSGESALAASGPTSYSTTGQQAGGSGSAGSSGSTSSSALQDLINSILSSSQNTNYGSGSVGFKI